MSLALKNKHSKKKINEEQVQLESIVSLQSPNCTLGAIQTHLPREAKETDSRQRGKGDDVHLEAKVEQKERGQKRESKSPREAGHAMSIIVLDSSSLAPDIACKALLGQDGDYEAGRSRIQSIVFACTQLQRSAPFLIPMSDMLRV